VVCADVLGYTASLTLGYRGFSDIVQQRSLAMIYMTHDSHHRCPRLQLALRLILKMSFNGFFHALFFFEQNIMAHFLYQQCCGILIQHLIDSDHHAHFHQFLDDFASLD